jgi:predicted enzyme related to lactoylglutathione lyase
VTSRIATIVLDAVDPDRIAAFWSAVLGWAETERDEEVITLSPPGGGGASMDVVAVPEGKGGCRTGCTWTCARTARSTEAELERLLGLGARHADVGQGPDVSWTVLADPEGNEFCLLARTVQDLA